MMNKLQRSLLFVFSLMLISSFSFAQDTDCDCENAEGDPVCVDFFGTTIQVENACIANCLELDIVEGDCDEDWPGDTIDGDWGGEWDDCECEESDWETEGVCYSYYDEFFMDTIVSWAPSECFIACFGVESYDLLDCNDLPDGSECDSIGGEWGSDCECDFDEESEGICFLYYDDVFQDSLFGWAPNECFIACWDITDYTITDCDWDGGEWDDEEWGSDCECDFDEESEGICFLYYDDVFQDSLFGWAPNECFIACWDITDYTITDCDWDGGEWDDEEWGSDCECDFDEESEGICFLYYDDVFQDSLFGWAPNECFIACWDITDYTITDCDWDGGEWDGEGEWGSDCECEDDGGDGICYTYYDETFGDTLFCWAPNECFIECLGIEEYTVSDCDWDWDGEGEWEEFDTCFLTILESDIETLQGLLLALNEVCGEELPDCILEAPIFDTDEEFIAYIEENCDDMGNFDGGIVGELLGSGDDNEGEELQQNTLTSATSLDVKVRSNPGNGMIEYTLTSTFDGPATISIVDMNGMPYSTQNVQLEKGVNVGELNATGLMNNIYILNVQSQNEQKNEKFFLR